MESQFQRAQQKENKVKEASNKMKSTSSSTNKSKFVGVRQRPSGKWVAEIKNTTQKIRIWLGTFDTAEEAARAYDEAACLLRGSNTRTNFVNSPSSNNDNSALSRRIRNLVNQKRMLINNSQPAPTPPTTTPSILKPTDNAANSSFVNFTCPTLDEKPDVFDYSWAFPQQFLPLIPDDFGILAKQVSFTTTLAEAGLMSNADEEAMLEFERVKVERQISASLYAMNGVNDYLQSIFNACDSIDHDPPMPYHNFCLG